MEPDLQFCATGPLLSDYDNTELLDLDTKLRSFVENKLILGHNDVTLVNDVYLLLVSFEAYVKSRKNATQIIKNVEKSAEWQTISAISEDSIATDFLYDGDRLKQSINLNAITEKDEAAKKTANDARALLDYIEIIIHNLVSFADEKYGNGKFIKNNKYQHAFNLTRNFMAFSKRHKEAFPVGLYL